MGFDEMLLALLRLIFLASYSAVLGERWTGNAAPPKSAPAR